MKLIVWVTREIAKMPSQHAVDHPQLPLNQRHLHPIVIQQDRQAAKISRIIPGIRRSRGKRLSKSTSVFFVTPVQNNSILGFFHEMEDTLLLTNTERPVTRGERQIPDTVLTRRFQTGPSARNSFDPKEGRFSINCGADQQKTTDLGTSLWQFSLHQQHLPVGR